LFILNIETATKNCSVSIAKDGQTLKCKEIAETGYSHAEKLHVFIEEILVETNLTFNDLAAIAVSQGPGSYTGLRIGVSAAKGLCYALNLPLIAVDTLQSIANQVVVNQGYIIPMIDARRMEVYSAIFDHNHQKIREIEAQIIDENSFSEINENIYVVGDCNDKIKTVLTQKNINFIDTICYPSANQMSQISFQKYQTQDFEDLAYFEPFYLKDFLITTKKP
jgi:tRNA threonylcarbamoyladenosine biosynthesis protein TsaB